MAQNSPGVQPNGMPQSTLTSTFTTGQRQHVHGSYIWLMPLTQLFAIIFVALMANLASVSALFNSFGRNSLVATSALSVLFIGGIIIIPLLIYGLLVALAYWAYRNLSFVFDEGEFSLYSGIIVKKRVHVPYARVQSVNHHATVIQRIFGICTVAIDTAGGAANKAVRIPYVSLSVAERLRSELFLRKAVALEQMAGGSAVSQQAPAVQQVPVPSAASDTSAASAVSAAISMPGVSSGASSAGAVATLAADTSSAQVAIPTYGSAAIDASGRPVPPTEQIRQHTESVQVGNGAQASNVLDDTVGDIATFRGMFGGATGGLEAVSYEHGLSNGQLLMASLSSSGMPMVIAIMSVIGFVTAFTGASALPLGLFALVVLIGGLGGMLQVIFSYGGFKVRRRGSRIEVEQGLLQRQFSGIDIARVQSISVRQTFFRRLIGYCEVSLGRIDALESNQQKKGSSANLSRGLVVHPFVKLSQVENILAGLTPELIDIPRIDQLVKPPRRALRRALIRRCIWRNGWVPAAIALIVALACLSVLRNSIGMNIAYTIDYTMTDMLLEAGASTSVTMLILDLLTKIIGAFLGLCLILTALQAVGAFLWYRYSGFACTKHVAAIRNDGLSSEFTMIPREKLQYAGTCSNPFQRFSQVASIEATTAAGVTKTVVRLWDVRADDAQRWLEWTHPRTGTAFSIEQITAQDGINRSA